VLSCASLHLSPRQTRSGRPLDFVFTSPHQPLCTSRDSVNDPELFGQYVCTLAGFKTFSQLGFAHKSDVNVELNGTSTSQVNCSQSKSYEISCWVTGLSEQQSDCEYLVSLTCSSCQDLLQVSPGTSLSLTSPLYPVLQPDFICEYELTSRSDLALDWTVSLTDLSLPAPHFSQSESGHCLQSFVQIEAGNSRDSMTSLSSLCGQTSSLQTISSTSTTRLRLLFVSGPEEEVGGFRGFNLSISCSLASSGPGAGVLAGSLLSLLLVLALLGGVLWLRLKGSKRRRRRRVRRGHWNGPVPRAGQSHHSHRTRSLSRANSTELRGLEGEEERREGQPNIYQSEEESQQPQYRQYRAQYSAQYRQYSTEYSVPDRRRRRSLPRPPVRPENPTPTVLVTDVTTSTRPRQDKIYETLSSLSSTDHPKVPQVPLRPSWTLQPTENRNINIEGSPLYLFVPRPSLPRAEIEEGPVAVSQAEKTEPKVSLSQRRKSMSETGKHLIKKISLSVNYDQLLYEEDHDDFENDDVFC